MTSERRRKANRENAQKSTGPKTQAGKNASRGNALRHGLAGDGLVLAPEDEALFRERLRAWTAEEQPRNEGEAAVLAAAVLASVQVDRCARDEFAAMEEKRYRAMRNWQRRQDRRITRISAGLEIEPARATQDLEEFASGCGWLAEQWQALGDALSAPGGWTAEQAARALRLLGVDAAADCAEAGPTAEALRAQSARLLADAAVDPTAREVARCALRALFDAEIDRLTHARDTLWYEEEAPALAESINLATIDLSRAGALRHRYAAAASSALHRNLAELSRRQAEQPAPARPTCASGTPPHPPRPAPRTPPEPAVPAAHDPALRNEAIEPSSTTNLSTTCVAPPTVTKPVFRPISTAPAPPIAAPTPPPEEVHPIPPPGPSP